METGWKGNGKRLRTGRKRAEKRVSDRDGSGLLKKKTAGFLLDLVYPRRCPVCDGLLPFGGPLICNSCRGVPKPVREPRCRKCGKMLLSEAREYCADCMSMRHSFDRAVSMFLYDSAMQASIYRYKYGNRREYADYYARCMASFLGPEIRSFRPEALVPVPLHRSKLKQRGFNQAELLAVRLGELLEIPVEAGLVKRVRETAPQKTLGREERRKNLKRSFTLCGNDVKLSRILVIDDIYTTGSTVDELSSVLKKGGAREVYAAALCSGTARLR